MSPLAQALATLLEDVDTAPDGEPLEDALDALTDFVQVNRTALVCGLEAAQAAPAAAPPAPPLARPDILSDYMRIVELAQDVTFVPAAVEQRGLAFLVAPVPEHMTEAGFQVLLEAEAQMMEDSGRAEMAITLRRDLRRRQITIESQERRDRQLADLAPLPGRRTIGLALGR